MSKSAPEKDRTYTDHYSYITSLGEPEVPVVTIQQLLESVSEARRDELCGGDSRAFLGGAGE